MKSYLTLVFASFLVLPALAQEESVPAAAVTDAPVDEAVVEGTVTEAGDTAGDEAEGPVLQVLEASQTSLEDFLWTARPIVVFADTPADPRYQEQLELLLARPEELLERDVVVIVDTDPAARSDIRIKLRPRGFMMTLIGKEGRVNLRKPFPWDVREITHAIDKWPFRQEEIRAQKAEAAAE